VSPAQPEEAWSDFTRTFFSPPNDLSPAADEITGKIIAWAKDAWLRSPASPFFLPVSASGWTYWYAICPNQEQRLWVRDLIRAYLGSWAGFSGPQPVPADSDMPLDQAVRALIGPDGCSFRLLIPRNANAETSGRQSVIRLTRALAARPYRQIHLTWPLGRLISDFSDACASGSGSAAEETLTLLEQDHRLSGANKLFLRLQYLATFARWTDLEESGDLPDLIRLNRPVLASDALARLVVARLRATADLADFAAAASEFGCLIGSVTMIRSAAGAQYYAYWSMSSGETPEAVATRLLDAGWLDQARDHSSLAALLPAAGMFGSPPAVTPSLADLRQALDGGRLDAAVDVLALMPPSAELLPVLVDLVTRTLSPRSIELLQQWRGPLGESAVQGALSGRPDASRQDVAIAAEPFPVALQAAFATDVTPVAFARVLDELRDQAVSRLMQPGVLREVIEAVRLLSRSVSPVLLANLIDLMLDMERDLFSAVGDIAGIQDLRLIVAEAWALGDESGDRHRVSRLLDLVGRALTAGVSPAVFDELVENLRAGWTPFLTDADLPLGLEAIELLAAAEPETAAALYAFATPILSRIGPHNARRIEAAVLETAEMLAPDFGLELSVVAEPGPGTGKSPVQAMPPAGTSVAIYSLMESAAARAAAIVRRWYPEVRVDIFAEKVATDALRYSARHADLLVIADKAATHAATDAIKAARGRRLIQYARGKGTASLVEAVLTGFDAIFGGTVASVSAQRTAG
jgi:hypothetical protein